MRPTSARSRNLLLVLALGLLLASLQDELGDAWQRALFFAHLGAFLLWQPLVAGDRHLSPSDVLLIAGGACVLAWFVNPWLLFAWTALVAALVGARGLDFAPRAERWLHLAALAFLVALLFTRVLPDLLPDPARVAAIPQRARQWAAWAFAAALPCLALAAWRIAPAAGTTRWPGTIYDPVHGVWMLLLLLLVGFGGLALMSLTGRGYLASIGIALVGVAALLVAADVLWRRRGGGPAGGGLGMLFSRYLLSYGMPYEVWLERLARLNRDEPDPARFLALAVESIGGLAPLAGANWDGALDAGGFGAREARHVETFLLSVQAGAGNAPARVSLILERPLSPALVWHLKLLLQIAVQFHAAKLRETRQHDAQYLRAIHETGARLTHDVKNLLQSLDGLIAAAGALEDDAQVRGLVDRQLPEIGRRLGQTLVKLQQPDHTDRQVVDALAWWGALEAQYATQGVVFETPRCAAGARLPQALFAAAADNLLQNALQKRRTEPDIAIRISLDAGGDGAVLRVEDSGSALADDLRHRLFRAPVGSRNGLGIGLYQVALQAQSLGMTLALENNRAGCVRFALTGVAQAGAGIPSAADNPVSAGAAPTA